MDQKVLEAMNEQIMYELYSSYFYLSMSAWANSENYPGFGNWLRVQAKEELEHAMKFYDFLLDRGEKVTLMAIEQPPVKFNSLKEVFTMVYEHEQKVTALINAIYAKALAGNDYASQTFLHWFINEQVEEEKNSSELLKMIERAESNIGALFQLDRKLAEREED